MVTPLWSFSGPRLPEAWSPEARLWEARLWEARLREADLWWSAREP